MDGPSRTVNPACVRPHRALASKGLGKRPVEFKPYCQTYQTTKARAAVNGQLRKPMQKYKYLSKPTASHMTSRSTGTAQSQGTGLVGGSWSRRVEGLYTKTVEPTESRPPV